MTSGTSTFARNEVPFEDPTGVDHEALRPGLTKAVYNYMHGLGLEEDVRAWFDFPVPRAQPADRLGPGRALRGQRGGGGSAGGSPGPDATAGTGPAG